MPTLETERPVERVLIWTPVAITALPLPYILPVMTFLVNFFVCPALPEAIINQEPQAWTTLEVTYGFTLVCSTISAHRFVTAIENRLFKDESMSAGDRWIFRLATTLGFTIGIIGGGTFSRLVWSCL